MTGTPGGYADGDLLQVYDREQQNREQQNDDRFIKHLLDRQERGLHIRSYEHDRAIRLIDRKLLGMVGFRYCSVHEAVRDAYLLSKRSL